MVRATLTDTRVVGGYFGFEAWPATPSKPRTCSSPSAGYLIRMAGSRNGRRALKACGSVMRTSSRSSSTRYPTKKLPILPISRRMPILAISKGLPTLPIRMRMPIPPINHRLS